jgi:hypothetical protein
MSAVGVLAVASGIGAVLAGLEPTGYRIVDVVWSLLLGAVVVVAGSRSRRWALLACAGLAAVSASGWMIMVGLAALVVAIVASAGDRRARVLGALVTALSVQALVRIDDSLWEFMGASALVAGVAMGVVVASGWRNAGNRWRRPLLRLAWISTGLAVLFVIGFGLAVAVSYSPVTTGVAKARNGVDAAGSDERKAAELFRAASADLTRASRFVASPLLAPVRVVPIVAQQHRAVSAATTTARDLADTAAEGAALVERDGLRPVDGRVDTAAVSELVKPLQSAVDALAAASVDLAALSSPWLVAPLVDRVGELERSVADALPATERALQGAQVLPAMAGGDGPRHWLMMITTPAESRMLGGFVANWAVIEAVDGRFDVVEDGSASDLNRQLAVDVRQVDATEEYLSRYSAYSPNVYFQNSSASPDFPSAARVAASFYQQSTGRPVEGVIALDPIALGSLVNVGGPIDLPALGRSFTGDELSEFLLVDLYNYDEPTQDDIFAEAINALVDGLTTGALPGPGVLASAMGTAAAESRVMMWSPFPEEESFLANLDVDGALPTNVGQDFLFLGLANLAPNKIDTYVERQMFYDVVYNADTGVTESVATVVLTNTATLDLPGVVLGNSSGLPAGTAHTRVSLYTPLFLERFEIDGQQSAVGLNSELGWRAWSASVEIPAGASVTLRWTLAGELDPGNYMLMWRPQPMVIGPTLNLDVRTIQPSSAAGGPDRSELVRRGAAAESFTVTAGESGT